MKNDNTMIIAGRKGIVRKMYGTSNKKVGPGFQLCNIVLNNGIVSVINLPEACRLQEVFVKEGDTIHNGQPVARVVLV